MAHEIILNSNDGIDEAALRTVLKVANGGYIEQDALQIQYFDSDDTIDTTPALCRIPNNNQHIPLYADAITGYGLEPNAINQVWLTVDPSAATDNEAVGLAHNTTGVAPSVPHLEIAEVDTNESGSDAVTLVNRGSATTLDGADLNPRSIGGEQPLAQLFAQSIDADTVDTESVLMGDYIGGVADQAIYLNGSEAVAIDAAGTIAQDTTHGDVIQQTHDAMDVHDTLWIAPGQYSCQDVSKITVDGASNRTILAHEVRIDQTYDIRERAIRLEGLQVSAPGDGFHWNRGQGGLFSQLTAFGCGGRGFVLGDEEGGQVTFATWKNCFANGCGDDGWVLSGPTNSWVNANVFINPISRGNDGIGFRIEGTSNYNEFYSHQTESNTGTTDIYVDANENSFYGGHTVGNIIAGPNERATLIVGGRHTGGIEVSDYWIPSNVKNRLSYRGTLNDGAGVDHPGELADEPVVNILDPSEVALSEASDSQNGHALNADLTSVLDGVRDAIHVDVRSYGERNLTGAAGQSYVWQWTGQITHDSDSTSHLTGTAVAEAGATIAGGGVSSRQLTLEFNTDEITTNLRGEVRLQRGRG